MELDRYKRQRVYEPKRQQRETPFQPSHVQEYRAPKEMGPIGSFLTSVDWQGLGSVASRIIGMIEKKKNEADVTNAMNRITDANNDYQERLREAKESGNLNEFVDDYQEIMRELQSKNRSELGDAGKQYFDQQWMRLNLDELTNLYKEVDKETAIERDKAAKTAVAQAIDRGNMKGAISAYLPLVAANERGLEVFDLNDVAKKDIAEYIEEGKDTGDYSKATSIIKKALDNAIDVQNGGAIEEGVYSVGSDSILFDMEDKVNLAKAKDYFRREGLEKSLQELTIRKASEFFPEIQGKNRDHLFAWASQKAVSFRTSLNQEEKRIANQTNDKMWNLYNSGKLTRDALANNAEALGHAYTSFWDNQLKVMENAAGGADATTTLKTLDKTYREHLKMIETGSVTLNDMLSHIDATVESFGDNVSYSEAMKAYDAKKLQGKAITELMIEVDQATFKDVDELEKKGIFTTTEAEQVKESIRSWWRDNAMENGRMKEELPTHDLQLAAYQNILRPALNKALERKQGWFNRGPKGEEFMGDPGYDVNDIISSRSSLYADKRYNSSVNSGIEALNMGGAIGMRTNKEVDEAVRMHQRRIKDHYMIKFQLDPNSVDVENLYEELPGGVLVFNSVEREKMKDGSTRLKVGEQKLVFDAGDGSENQKFIDYSDFKNKYPVYGGDPKSGYGGMMIDTPDGTKINVGGEWMAEEDVNRKGLVFNVGDHPNEIINSNIPMYDSGRLVEDKSRYTDAQVVQDRDGNLHVLKSSPIYDMYDVNIDDNDIPSMLTTEGGRVMFDEEARKRRFREDTSDAVEDLYEEQPALRNMTR